MLAFPGFSRELGASERDYLHSILLAALEVTTKEELAALEANRWENIKFRVTQPGGQDRLAEGCERVLIAWAVLTCVHSAWEVSEEESYAKMLVELINKDLQDKNYKEAHCSERLAALGPTDWRGRGVPQLFKEPKTICATLRENSRRWLRLLVMPCDPDNLDSQPVPSLLEVIMMAAPCYNNVDVVEGQPSAWTCIPGGRHAISLAQQGLTVADPVMHSPDSRRVNNRFNEPSYSFRVGSASSQPADALRRARVADEAG